MHLCGSGCGSKSATKQETKRSVSLVGQAVAHSSVGARAGPMRQVRVGWGVSTGQALCGCLWLLHTENQLIKEILGLSGKLER